MNKKLKMNKKDFIIFRLAEQKRLELIALQVMNDVSFLHSCSLIASALHVLN